jgi:hypothetical protein
MYISFTVFYAKIDSKIDAEINLKIKVIMIQKTMTKLSNNTQKLF